MTRFLISLLLLFLLQPLQASEKEGYSELFDLLGIEKKASETAEVKAAVLASFSMPEASLERLARDAKDAGIPLVFRGVLKNPSLDGSSTPEADGGSPKKRIPLLSALSLTAFEPLIAQGAAVEINPELFTEFGVSEVPALLLYQNGAKDKKGLSEKQNLLNAKGALGNPGAAGLLVTGDATLGHLLDLASERQDLFGKEAARIRADLGGRL